MANSKYPPAGFDPIIWRRIQAKREREFKAEVKALYKVSAILWAVVKGYDTDELLAQRFSTTRPDALQRWTARAMSEGHIRWWGGKYRPIDKRHKQLKKRLEG